MSEATLKVANDWDRSRPLVASLALVGPVCAAVGNFALMLAATHVLSSSAFGLFAFAQVIVAAGMSLSSALFTAHLNVAYAKSDGLGSAHVATLARGNVVFALAGAGCASAIYLLSNASPLDAVALATLVATAIVRWFGRSLALVRLDRRSALHAEILYGVCTCASAGISFFWGGASLAGFLWLQFACFAAAAIPLGATISSSVSTKSRPAREPVPRGYYSSGFWNVLAVVSGQLCTTAHAYVITLMLGSGAFAPIALVTLLFRPTGVLLTGLVQYEQPRLARAAIGHDQALTSGVNTIRSLSFVAWLGNSVVAAAIAYFRPGLLGQTFPGGVLGATALAAVSLVVLIRGQREAALTALAAVGNFRAIAKSSLCAAPAALITTVMAAVLVPENAVWCLGGPVVGEAISFVIVRRTARCQ